MPFDSTTAIVFGSLLCALVLSLAYSVWYQNLKHRSNSQRSLPNSVGLKELEEMMRRSVEDSIRPLKSRFDRLEDEVRTIQAEVERDRTLELPGSEPERRERPPEERPEWFVSPPRWVPLPLSPA